MNPDLRDDVAIDVACLCAAWCRTCEAYRPMVQRVAMSLAPGRWRWHWIDVEDDADWVGNLEIETFPTWVVAGPEGLRFAGVLLPHEDTLRRTLKAALDGPVGRPPEVDAEAWQALARRLRRRPAWDLAMDQA